MRKQVSFNFHDYETATVAKNCAKKTVYEVIKEALIKEFGNYYVTEVGSSELSVCVGGRNHEEVCANVKVSGKDCDYKTTKSRRITPYDRFRAGVDYRKSLKVQRDEDED